MMQISCLSICLANIVLQISQLNDMRLSVPEYSFPDSISDFEGGESLLQFADRAEYCHQVLLDVAMLKGLFASYGEAGFGHAYSS